MWIVEAAGGGIWARSKVGCIHVLLLFHHYYAVVLDIVLVGIKVSFHIAYRATSVRKLSSLILLVWFIKCISMRIGGWLPTTTNSSMIPIILIPSDIHGVVEVLEAVHLTVDRLLPLIDIVSIVIL